MSRPAAAGRSASSGTMRVGSPNQASTPCGAFCGNATPSHSPPDAGAARTPGAASDSTSAMIRLFLPIPASQRNENEPRQRIAARSVRSCKRTPDAHPRAARVDRLLLIVSRVLLDVLRPLGGKVFLRKDRCHRALVHAQPAIDARVGVDVEHLRLGEG